MANFNNANYIEEAIDSVMKQSFQDYEIIFVDDSSTDDSKKIIKILIRKYSIINVIFLTKNKGYGNALKVAAQNASGKLLAILDPDDTYHQDALEIMYNVYKNNKDASLLYSTMYMCNEKLEIDSVNKTINQIPQEQTYQSLRNNTNYHISHLRVITANAYIKTSGFNPNFKRAVDKDIIYKLEEVGDIVFVNKPLYYYRQHPGSISLNKNVWKARIWELKAKKDAYWRRLKMPDIPNLTKKQLQEEARFVYRQLALFELKQKRYRYYLLSLVHLVRYMPVKEYMKFIYYSLKKKYRPKSFMDA